MNSTGGVAVSAEKQMSTKGWNWGWYHLRKDQLELSHDPEGTKKAFTLKYKDIALSNAAKENEVQIEFQDEQR